MKVDSQDIKKQPIMQNIIAKALPILKKAGITHSSLFGSYVRGENHQNSDIDILIDLPRGKTLFDLVDIQINLEKAVGKSVDLVTYKSLHPLLKERILSEQIRIL